jgi:hypothetical protein
MIVQQDYLNSKQVKENFQNLFLFCFQIFSGIENLRLEREQILSSTSGKKQRHRSSITQQKSFDSPIQSFASLEQDT